jgi:hypothetical protein
MPQFRSLPSFHHDDADVIEEPLMQAVPVSQPLKLKAFATVSTEQFVEAQRQTGESQRSQEPNTDSLTNMFTSSAQAQIQQVQPVTPFVTRRLSYPFHSTRELSQNREDEPITGQMSPHIVQNLPFLSLVPTQSTGPRTPNTFAAVSSPSLITALQSTMVGHKKTDQMVVIPATMKRTQVLPETGEPPRRMRRRFRHAIALGVTFAVLLLTLLSLAPLDKGQSTYNILASAVQWGSTGQQNWDISAHTMAQLPGNGGDATTGGSTTTTTTANTANLPTLNLPTSQYIAIAQQDAISAGISPDYFVRQIYAESSFNPNAYSPAGAVGIAQFEPGTAAALGIDPYDPISALKGAALFMSQLSSQYGGDYAKALAAYNAGGGNVQAAVQSCGAGWLSCTPVETQNYVYKIMGI